MSHDVIDADAIDVLRLKAFKTNKPADRDAYSNAVSRWFQDRHARDMAAEIEVAKLVSEAEARVAKIAAGLFPGLYDSNLYQIIAAVRAAEAAAIRSAAEETGT